MRLLVKDFKLTSGTGWDDYGTVRICYNGETVFYPNSFETNQHCCGIAEVGHFTLETPAFLYREDDEEYGGDRRIDPGEKLTPKEQAFYDSIPDKVWDKWIKETTKKLVKHYGVLSITLATFEDGKTFQDGTGNLYKALVRAGHKAIVSRHPKYKGHILHKFDIVLNPVKEAA